MPGQKRTQVLGITEAQRVSLALELLDVLPLVGDRLPDDGAGESL